MVAIFSRSCTSANEPIDFGMNLQEREMHPRFEHIGLQTLLVN
jgi:hypothetical protein